MNQPNYSMIPMNNQAFVQTVYIGQTDKKPSRIKATNVTSGKYVYMSWNYDWDVLQNHLEAAKKLYEALGQPVPRRIVFCSTFSDKGYMITATE